MIDLTDDEHDELNAAYHRRTLAMVGDERCINERCRYCTIRRKSMTRSEKCTWLVQVWREHHDPAYARVAQHMYVGASPADICLFEGITQAQLRGIIVALASSLAEGLS